MEFGEKLHVRSEKSRVIKASQSETLDPLGARVGSIFITARNPIQRMVLRRVFITKNVPVTFQLVVELNQKCTQLVSIIL